MKKYAVGIDIGGTKIAVGIVDQEGTVIANNTIASGNKAPGQAIAEIVESILTLCAETGIKEDNLDGIGIGAPGPLDTKRGVLTNPPNLPGWTEYPITDTLRKRFTLPITIENDASAAAVAEKWIGAAKDNDNYVYITISTGIGAGLFLDGKLFTGTTGNAGDVGFMIINAGTGLGSEIGYFEKLCSGTAIASLASEMYGSELTTKQVFELYGQRDPKITPFVEETFRLIGMGCVSLVNIFDPEKIVIGGGVSLVGEPLFTAVQSYVSKHALNPSGRNTAIVPSELREHTGLIGAAALILWNQTD